MTNANMKLVLASVLLGDNLDLPQQKLEAGEFIVPRVVELTKLHEELKGMSSSSLFLYSYVVSPEYARKVGTPYTSHIPFHLWRWLTRVLLSTPDCPTLLLVLAWHSRFEVDRCNRLVLLRDSNALMLSPGFLRSIDMRSELLLFFAQGCLLLTPHRSTTKYHHYRFISGLFPVGRAAWSLFLLLTLIRAEFLAAFTASLDRCHTLSIVGFCLFPGTQDVSFGDENVLALARV